MWWVHRGASSGGAIQDRWRGKGESPGRLKDQPAQMAIPLQMDKS